MFGKKKETKKYPCVWKMSDKDIELTEEIINNCCDSYGYYFLEGGFDENFVVDEDKNGNTILRSCVSPEDVLDAFRNFIAEVRCQYDNGRLKDVEKMTLKEFSQEFGGNHSNGCLCWKYSSKTIYIWLHNLMNIVYGESKIQEKKKHLNLNDYLNCVVNLDNITNYNVDVASDKVVITLYK